jgi:hypothetical protein
MIKTISILMDSSLNKITQGSQGSCSSQKQGDKQGFSQERRERIRDDLMPLDVRCRAHRSYS